MKIHHKIFAIFLIFFTFFVNNQAQAQFLDLGVLSSWDKSKGYAISDDASVITGLLETTSKYGIFQYKNGVMSEINPSLYNNFAGDVSGDGSIIVGSAVIDSSNTSIAFKYENGVLTDLGNLGGDSADAIAISGNGLVIGGISDISGNSASHAFKYENGIMTDLGTLGGNYSNIYGINYDGSVLVGQSFTTGDLYFHAIKHENGVMTDLGTLGGNNSAAFDVSDDGSIIVGESTILTSDDSSYRAFKYENGVMTDLGTLGGTTSNAYAISGDGSIIAGAADITGDSEKHAFKYENGVMTDLGTLGGENSMAFGITSNGQVIIGQSQISDGTIHAFMYGTYTDTMVDLNNTVQTLYYNNSQLNSLINLKNSLLKSVLNQDCKTYGKNNLCIGLSYRYSNVNEHNAQENAANLKVSYKFNPHLKLGFVLDQVATNDAPENFKVRNYQPTIAVFTTISQNYDETGFNLRFAAAYDNLKTTIKRDILENTEAGSGSTNLSSIGLLGQISYKLKILDKFNLEPFLALRQTNIKRNGYTEDSSAAFPITYKSVSQKLTTKILGINSELKITKKLSTNFSLAIEDNISSHMDGYVGYVPYIGNFSMNSPKIRNTTTLATIGFNYNLQENHNIYSSFSYNKQAFNNADNSMIYLGYLFGF